MNKNRKSTAGVIGETLEYKSTVYVIMGRAMSLNGGEYYVCSCPDFENDTAWLIPTDSEEVRFHD